jgi:hypothetical protein
VAAVSLSTDGGQFYFGDGNPYSTDQSARKATSRNRSTAANRAAPSGYNYDTTSSDPASSSNPPTPKNSNYNQPVVIEQGLTPRKHGGHPAPYLVDYDYMAGHDFEKEVTELFNETLPDLPMPAGFVDRIRSILGGNEKTHEMGLPSSSGVLTTMMDPDVHSHDVAELPPAPMVPHVTREMIIATLDPAPQFHMQDICPMAPTDIIMDSTVISLFPDRKGESTADSDFEDCCEVESVNRCSVLVTEPENENRQPSNASLATGSVGSTPVVEETHATAIIQPPGEPQRPKVIPTVATMESQAIIEKIKRHWSLHRAAVGPTRIPSLVFLNIPPRRSSSAASKGSMVGPGESLPQIEITVDGSVSSPRSSIADNGQVIWTSKGRGV